MIQARRNPRRRRLARLAVIAVAVPLAVPGVAYADATTATNLAHGCVRMPDRTAPGYPALIGVWLLDPATRTVLSSVPLATTLTGNDGCYALTLPALGAGTAPPPVVRIEEPQPVLPPPPDPTVPTVPAVPTDDVKIEQRQPALLPSNPTVPTVPSLPSGPSQITIGPNQPVLLMFDATVPTFTDIGEAVQYVTGQTSADDDATILLGDNGVIDLIFTATDLAPSPPLVCPDIENGCDRTFIDPTDPTGQYGFWGAPDPLAGITGTNTNSFTRQADRGDFTGLNFNAVRNWDGSAMPEGGHIGIDHQLGEPGQKGVYAPCHTTGDPYKGACSTPSTAISYTLVKNWFKGNQTNFSHGIFIANASTKSSCPTPCQHWWGQRSQQIDAELYATYDTGTTDLNYVRVRFAETWDQFTGHGNGGTYGPGVGQIRLAKKGQSGIGTLGGLIKRNGTAVSKGEVTIRIWPNSEPRTSTGGEQLATFATPGSNANGFYMSGALYAGAYRILVTDTVTGKCRKFFNRTLSAGGWRMDFDVSQDDFGQGMTAC